MIRRPPGRLAVTAAVVSLLASVLAACSTPAVKPRAIFFGLDVPNPRSTQAQVLGQAVGHQPTVESVFVKLDTTSMAADLNTVHSQGYIPFVTLEPWLQGMARTDTTLPSYSLASIVDGSHDRQLRALATAVAAYNRPIYLRFAHEMNGNWYPWAETVNGNTPGEYVAAWKHVHALFDSARARKVSWVWSPNIVQKLSASAPALSEVYPGDDYVDYVGMTGYAHNIGAASTTFGTTVHQLESLTSKPILLSEIGAEGAAQAAWLKSLGTYIRDTSQIAGFIYFDTSAQTTGASGNYRIDGKSSSLGALRASLEHLGVPTR